MRSQPRQEPATCINVQVDCPAVTRSPAAFNCVIFPPGHRLGILNLLLALTSSPIHEVRTLRQMCSHTRPGFRECNSLSQLGSLEAGCPASCSLATDGYLERAGPGGQAGPMAIAGRSMGANGASPPDTTRWFLSLGAANANGRGGFG